jgi:hypothetical protein
VHHDRGVRDSSRPVAHPLGSVAPVTDLSSPTSRLTPSQESTLDVLRRSGPPLVFSEQFVQDLRDEANEAFAHFTDRLNGNTVFVTKHTLAGVFGCEAQFLAPDEFSWTPSRARGQVAHRAIQLLINWRGEAEPADLVDEAIARLINEERGLAPWLEPSARATSPISGRWLVTTSPSSWSASRRSTRGRVPSPRAAPSGRSTGRS